MVKVVSKEAILQLEKDLVNQILDNYLQIKHFIEDKRNVFLKKERKSRKNAYSSILNLEHKFRKVKERIDIQNYLRRNVQLAKRKEQKLIRNVRQHCKKY